MIKSWALMLLLVSMLLMLSIQSTNAEVAQVEADKKRSTSKSKSKKSSKKNSKKNPKKNKKRKNKKSKKNKRKKGKKIIELPTIVAVPTLTFIVPTSTAAITSTTTTSTTTTSTSTTTSTTNTTTTTRSTTTMTTTTPSTTTTTRSTTAVTTTTPSTTTTTRSTTAVTTSTTSTTTTTRSTTTMTTTTPSTTTTTRSTTTMTTTTTSTTTTTTTPTAQPSCALKNKKTITAGYWGAYQFTSMVGLCEDYDVIYLSFMTPWSGTSPPTLRTTYCISDGPKCWSVPEQIAYCQSKGAQFLLSIGGAIDPSPGFQSSQEAKNLALLIHNQYGNGKALTSDNRPIGSQILDGIDLNQENFPDGGYKYLADFVDEIRRLEPTWCLSAAPQCYLGYGGKDQNVGEVIVQRKFDLLSIHFYNNPSCNNGQPGFYTNFNEWLKPEISNGARLLVGALLTSGSGIVDASTLGNQLVTLKNSLSTTDKERLAGFSVWAVDADNSKDFVTSVKKIYV